MFNELTLDHRHVKYQSVANLSWYIGFDKLGNPISGQDIIKRDVLSASQQLDAIGRERCYLFTKMNRLTTSTQFFPEALELIEKQQQQSSSIATVTANPNDSKQSQAAAMYQSAQAAQLAKKRGSSVVVHSFNQKQLINMTRYRNILRYQLGRAANQPILAADTNTMETHVNETQLGTGGSTRVPMSNVKWSRRRNESQNKMWARQRVTRSAGSGAKRRKTRQERHLVAAGGKLGLLAAANGVAVASPTRPDTAGSRTIISGHVGPAAANHDLETMTKDKENGKLLVGRRDLAIEKIGTLFEFGARALAA